MAKKPARRSATRGGGIPAPSKQAAGGTDFNPFLKTSDVGDVGDTGTITALGGEARVVDGNFGEQLVIPVKFNGDRYDWGINIDSPNHRQLYDRFGKNPKNWKGKIAVEVKLSRAKRPFIAVVR